MENYGDHRAGSAHFRPSDLEAISGGQFTPVLVNETTVAANGWDDPIGKRFACCIRPTAQVVGVVEDFHFQALQEQVRPAALMPSWFSPTILVRAEAGAVRSVIDHIEDTWARHAPGRPLLLSFVSDRFRAAYSAEQRLATGFGLFALLAILVACLGLFGLATFAAQSRTREIGVRKAVGASVAAIVSLLSGDFMRLVVAALALAIPLAIVLAGEWLEEFPYRVSVGIGDVAMAVGAVLATAALAVGYRSLMAAMGNPVDALRYE